MPLVHAHEHAIAKPLRQRLREVTQSTPIIAGHRYMLFGL